MRNFIATFSATIILCGCSLNQIAETAYDSVRNGECLDKTGEIHCDLSDKDNDGISQIDNPGENTNEALEKKARIAREKQK